MPRSQKLKVYRTPIGFHDAYVAAPSQKAALEAWGSDANLFARGVAETVTDETLTAEPLANPGKVVRRLRGSAEEQLAALPPDRPRSRRSPSPPASTIPGSRKTASAPAPSIPSKRTDAKRPPPKPRPSREELDEAEQHLDNLLKDQKAADEQLRDRERQIARDRRELERSQQRDRRAAERRVEKEREAHLAALSRWRADE